MKSACLPFVTVQRLGWTAAGLLAAAWPWALCAQSDDFNDSITNALVVGARLQPAIGPAMTSGYVFGYVSGFGYAYERLTGDLVMTWPGYASNFVFQCSSELPGVSWTPVTDII